MRALAERLDEPADLWGNLGLLHDLDYEQTVDRRSEHGLKTAAILAKSDLPSEGIAAIKAHNAEALGVERVSKLDFALTCAESITGLVVATALTQEPGLRRELLEARHVDRLNLGSVPTSRISWDQPHEGNLFEHLYRQRALQEAAS